MGSNVQKWQTTEGEWSLNNLKTPITILYFYPKDSTPGCTREGQDFSELYPKFKKMGVAVYGVSRDSMKSHQNFCEKHGISVPLISDPDETLCKKFDVIKEKNMYGKKVLGIERSTFILDSKGRVLHEWRKVKVDGHAQEVFEWVKSHLKASDKK